MAAEMADFLNRVSSDPALLHRFEADPDAVLDTTDLSDEHKAILKSGDADEIRAALGDQSVGIPITVVISRG